jgi:hypothetical protein
MSECFGSRRKNSRSAHPASARYTDARPIFNAFAIADGPVPLAFTYLIFAGSMLSLPL